MSYTVHENCRACGYGPPLNRDTIKSGSGSQKLESILNLGVLPLPNAFKKSGQARPGHYPVELLVCPRCHLGQLSAVVDPAVLYADYPYVTSPSATMKAHFAALWDLLRSEQKISVVAEIGSNDGLLLEEFGKLGAEQVIGIDPAANLVELARGRGVNSLCALFDRQAAEMARAAVPAIDVILARHVFCHVDDWEEFINNIGAMCEKKTLVAIEVPYAHDTIANCEWDQVYAEHLSYLTIRSMVHLLQASPLRLQHIVRFPVHGGAIVMLLRRIDHEGLPNKSVDEFLEAEKCSLDDWRVFACKAAEQISDLKFLVKRLREQGKRVVGYGASAKSTMWINACGFTKRDIEGIYDYTPQKLYTTTPGTDIPVVHEGGFYASAADYAVVWCWNFLPEILKRQEKWIQGGGRFIVPVPEVKIL
jgi:novobiocin biosynthesis protein NovU/D-mycarose 3-C-methyltransferase